MDLGTNSMYDLNFIDLLLDMLKIEERIQKLENIEKSKLFKFCSTEFKLKDRLEILRNDKKKRSEIQKAIVSLKGNNRCTKTSF